MHLRRRAAPKRIGKRYLSAMYRSRQPASRANLMAQPVARIRHWLQPSIPVYPHVYPPETPIPKTQHPCALPADLPEQVQNIE